MTDKTAYFSNCCSENIQNFDYPYDSGSQMIMTIRKSPKFGRDIYIRLTNGQFDSDIDGTVISVRANDGKIVKFSCDETDDGSTNVLFINSYSRFLSILKHSNKLRIQVPIFQAGVQVFKFTTSGLKWNH